jgi:hypothetical protein
MDNNYENVEFNNKIDSSSFISFPPKVPLWIKLWNFVNVAPIIVWPLILLSSAFFFDAPASKLQAYIAFAVVNSYPILLILSLVSSFLLYRKGKINLSIIIPIIASIINICVITLIIRYLL